MTLAELDSIAAAAERRWGVDRLPLLVPADLAARFQSMMAIMRGEAPKPPGTTPASIHAGMARAWTALDAAAATAGAAEASSLTWRAAPPEYSQPHDPDRPWYILPLATGHQAAICRDDEHEARARATANHLGVRIDIYTATALVHVLMTRAPDGVAAVLGDASVAVFAAVMDAWPGGDITVRPRPGRLPQDDIPFGGEVGLLEHAP